MSEWEDFCDSKGWNIGSEDDYDAFVDSLDDDEERYETEPHEPQESGWEADTSSGSVSQEQSYYLIENLIRRAFISGGSFGFTDLEIKALKHALEKLKPCSETKNKVQGLDDFCEEIPF